MMRNMVEKGLASLLVALFIATVLTVTWQVIGRYLLETPSSATEEIARFLLIWLALLSAAYAFARRMHVGVDLISAHLDTRYQILVARIIWLGCTAFALCVMVYGGAMLVNITRTLGQTSAAMGLPIWMIYSVMPLSGALIAFFSISFMISGVPADHALDEETADD